MVKIGTQKVKPIISAEKAKPVIKKAIEIPATITVRELAAMMSVSPIEIIKVLMSNGIMANINQQIDFDTVSIIGEEMGYEISSPYVSEPEIELIERQDIPLHRRLVAEEDPKDLEIRPPVVTVLGHVDHGKTTLLDMIRKTKVAEGEAGGITQHIGAYQVKVGDRSITFLDTPGHAAFTAMRARGAQATDLAVLVVAADDGVMPQTKEAIEHVRAAQVPIIVAVNKIDKDNANPQRVLQELADVGLVPESWGGDIVCVPISAKQNVGIDELLEHILLITEVAELKANPNRLAQGVVIEGKIDKRRGVMATLLVKNGTLVESDFIVIGTQYCRVRAMFDYRGKRIKKAGLSVPTSVLGLPAVPEAGDFFTAVPSEKAARFLVEQRKDKATVVVEEDTRRTMSLEQFFKRRGQNGNQTLNVVLKADVQGSVEPIVNSLKNLEVNDLKIKLILQGTGNISESDINLAVASDAIVLGFNVEMDSAAHRLAEALTVDVRQYSIIYKLIEDVEKALRGLLAPEYADKVIGRAEVREVFKVPKRGNVAGSYIVDGRVVRNAIAKVFRQQGIIHESKLVSLRRFTEDVQEVATGFLCGIGIEGFNDFRPGDIIEAYIKERVN